eukprot:Selendium_serpulae@DN5553_c0_g1_i9.p1
MASTVKGFAMCDHLHVKGIGDKWHYPNDTLISLPDIYPKGVKRPLPACLPAAVPVFSVLCLLPSNGFFCFLVLGISWSVGFNSIDTRMSLSSDSANGPISEPIVTDWVTG